MFLAEMLIILSTTREGRSILFVSPGEPAATHTTEHTMTAADAAIFAELRPFIVARMKAGESFESALAKAADDAMAFASSRREQILDEVYTECRAR